MYGSIDGAFVPLEAEWKEAKTVSWYQVGSRYGKDELHAKEIAYYTSLEPAETFGDLLWGTGVHHQADRSAVGLSGRLVSRRSGNGHRRRRHHR